MGAVKNVAIGLAYEFEKISGRDPTYEELEEMFKFFCQGFPEHEAAVKVFRRSL